MLKTGIVLACALAMGAAHAAPDTLAQILNTKTLTVCSPGDYKPFSFDNNGTFSGIDNDLVSLLAQSLNANLVMVKTTWKNLLPDFTAGKCDMAIGGISITLPRQQHAFFSTPYFVNGKTPLVRCADKQKYQTVKAINQPSVKVIYNPGGSNEKFAKARLNKAQLTENKDNLTIFQKVIDGDADVFVTEAAEARVQSHLHPELCAVNPGHPLKPSENAYLLPNDDIRFKLYVDQFLHLAQKDGSLGKIIAKWLPN